MLPNGLFLRVFSGASASLVCWFASCAPPDVFPLGSDQYDDRAVADTPAAYLLDALGEDSGTLGELVGRERDAFAFGAAPDPTALLTSTSALDDARDPAGTSTLRVLSYNARRIQS